jgi:phosphodiester glycosidase
MPRAAMVLLSLALVVASGTAAMSATPLPRGYIVVSSANMYTGVDYVKLTKPNVPVVAHVARILPGAPVDFRVVNASDKVSTSIRDLELTSSMCGRVRCVVGVNGGFHRLGVPVGGIVSDGRMLRSPDPGRAQLTVTTEGELVAGQFSWTGSLTAADGVQIPVAAVNTAPPANGLALYTSAYGGRTETSTRTELLVKAPASIGSLNKVTDLEVTGIRAGAGPIPAGGAVFSGDGVAAQQLVDLWARQQNGMAPGARLVVSSPISASASLGVEPVVLRDGARAPGWRDPNLINPRQPHTLIGWNKAGETYLVAVDGRQAASDGVTMAEAADFLLGLGATDAVSLDGGGGTTFVAGRSVWNRPSDDDPVHPSEYEERGAVNAFVVMSRPGAPLPPAAPPRPEPFPQTLPGSPGSPGSPPTSGGGVVSPGTVPGTGSDSGPWPTATNGSTSWPTPADGRGVTPGAPTSRLGGKPAPATVVVSPASAGSRMLPGVAGPRLVLIDPPASDAPVAESGLATSSDTVTKRAHRKGSSPSTIWGSADGSQAMGAPSGDGASSWWAMSLKAGAVVVLVAVVVLLALVARRRRPLVTLPG